MFRIVLSAFFVAVSYGCAFAAESATPAQITGSVTYRQKIALLPNSVLRVQLQDVLQTGAPATTVAEASTSTGSAQVPFDFTISYAPTSIAASHRYVVRASISSEGKLEFTTDVAQPVLTNGAPTHVDLVLVPAPVAEPQTQTQTQTQSSASLEGTYWKLVELGGVPPATVTGVTEAHLQFDAVAKHIAALGGCNRLMGTYTVRGAALTVAAGGMTMMACPDPLGKQELAFTDMLRATKGYRITGNTLELLDADKVVARFIAVTK